MHVQHTSSAPSSPVSPSSPIVSPQIEDQFLVQKRSQQRKQKSRSQKDERDRGVFRKKHRDHPHSNEQLLHKQASNTGDRVVRILRRPTTQQAQAQSPKQQPQNVAVISSSLPSSSHQPLPIPSTTSSLQQDIKTTSSSSYDETNVFRPIFPPEWENHIQSDRHSKLYAEEKELEQGILSYYQDSYAKNLQTLQKRQPLIVPRKQPLRGSMFHLNGIYISFFFFWCFNHECCFFYYDSF